MNNHYIPWSDRESWNYLSSIMSQFPRHFWNWCKNAMQSIFVRSKWKPFPRFHIIVSMIHLCLYATKSSLVNQISTLDLSVDCSVYSCLQPSSDIRQVDCDLSYRFNNLALVRNLHGPFIINCSFLVENTANLLPTFTIINYTKFAKSKSPINLLARSIDAASFRMFCCKRGFVQIALGF